MLSPPLNIRIIVSQGITMQEQQSLYEVESIIRMKIQNNQRLFRIKWVGYPSCQNTWEPQEHLNQELVSAYLQKEKEKNQIRRNKELNITDYLPSANIVQEEIVSMVEPKKGESLIFLVRKGKRKEKVRRQHLLEEQPELLARFYLNKYLEGKKSQNDNKLLQ